MFFRPRRSVLYVPGSNLRALDKARDLAADVLIFDLEDAVAPEQKEMARQALAGALARGGYGDCEIVVRINALDTPWFADDLKMAAQVAPDAILAPKVDRAQDVVRLAGRMAAAGMKGIALWVMMEQPLAVLNAQEIAQAAARTPLAALVMGVNDLAAQTHASLENGRMAFIPWLMTCVAAARAFGLAIVDGVFNDLGDAAGLAAECRQGRLLGMDGKTLIHPAQIDIANAAFSPTEDEIARAMRIIVAFDAPGAAGAGVLRVDGRMVERLHLEAARRTLALARAMGGKDAQ